MRTYRQTKFNRRARGRRRSRDRVHEDIPADPTRRLLWACYYSDNDMAREAIKSGAKIDGAGDDAAVTPLINACKTGSLETIRIVIAAGADPNLAGKDGMTPLHYVAQRNNAEAAEDLIRAGADPVAKNDAGETPVQLAMDWDNEEVAIAIQGLISLAHSNKAKIIRFPDTKDGRRRKPPAKPASVRAVKFA